MPCSPVKVNARFGGTYRLSHQVRRISVFCRHRGSFLLDLQFDLEDGDGIFLRIVGSLSSDYMAL
jgi:hypothetical protein